MLSSLDIGGSSDNRELSHSNGRNSINHTKAKYDRGYAKNSNLPQRGRY